MALVTALNLTDRPVWASGAVLTAGAVAVWLAGTRLSRVADAIADRTGIGRAFVGAVLLAAATSLPEAATALTAAGGGDAGLAAGYLLGGVAMQTAVLAVADAVVLRDRALTRFAARPVLLLQGVTVVTLLALVLAGRASGLPIRVAHVSG